MYHNFIFDLYGTLVDIHTNENKTSPLEKACAVLFLPGCFLYGEGTEEQISPAGNGCQQGSLILHLSGDLRRRYFSNSLCRKRDPTHRGSSDRYRSVLPDRIPQYFTMLSRHDRHTAAAPCKRLWIYLLSNAQRIFTEYELRSLGLWDLFDGILISSDEGCCKPDPAFFRILFDRYGLDFTTCLMTGNERTRDLAGAIAAGIDCCYLHTATSSGSADEPPKKPALQLWMVTLMRCKNSSKFSEIR